MSAETLAFRSERDQRAAIPRTIAHLRADGLLAYPTETVYGFGCLLRAGALANLARLKRRPSDAPFLLLVNDANDVPDLRWNDAARDLADAFWPGPLTLALRADSAHLPGEVVAPDGTVAIRSTSHAGVRALLGELREPITSTSANAPGRAAATSAASAEDALAEIGASAALLLDGGSLPASPPSTLISCAARRPRLLRAGAIPLAEVRRVVREIDD